MHINNKNKFSFDSGNSKDRIFFHHNLFEELLPIFSAKTFIGLTVDKLKELKDILSKVILIANNEILTNNKSKNLLIQVAEYDNNIVCDKIFYDTYKQELLQFKRKIPYSIFSVYYRMFLFLTEVIFKQRGGILNLSLLHLSDVYSFLLITSRCIEAIEKNKNKSSNHIHIKKIIYISPNGECVDASLESQLYPLTPMRWDNIDILKYDCNLARLDNEIWDIRLYKKN